MANLSKEEWNSRMVDNGLPIISHHNELWFIVQETKNINDNGETYCLLANTVNGCYVKNGWYPQQAGDFVKLTSRCTKP